MQLTLVNTVNAKLVVDGNYGGEDTTYCFWVQAKRPSEDGNNDNILLSKVTGDAVSILRIVMVPTGDSTTHDIIVSSNKGFNLLKKLRELFQDKVKIYVEISANDPSGNQRGLYKHCISFPGMTIDADQFTGNARTDHLRSFFYINIFSRETYGVKVTAEIEDDILKPYCNTFPPKETNKKILEEGSASDVVIEAGNGAEIRSHKCFLVSTSSVFERMFANEMEESKIGRIEMSDVSEEGVRTFLRFIYQGDVLEQGASIDLAYEMLYAGHKYDLPKLESFMKTYLVGRKDEDFSANLAFKIYSFVRGIKTASDLKDKMVGIMGMNSDKLKELPEFKEVFRKNPDDAMEIFSSVVESLKRKMDHEQINDATKKPKNSDTKGPKSLQEVLMGLTGRRTGNGDEQ